MERIDKIVRLFLMAVIVLLTGSCVREIFPDNGLKIEEGIPTKVRLGYVSEESVLETRSSQTAEYENRIENIYLFVFNSSGQRQPLLKNMEGDLLESNLFDFNGMLTPDDGNPSLGKGSLEFVCGSLQKAKIVAIANVTDGSTTTAYNVTPKELDDIQTLPDLERTMMKMDVMDVTRGAMFMMTGYAEDPEGKTEVDITGSESGETLDCTLKLERTDAKIEVKVNSHVPDKYIDLWTDFSFRPQSWKVVNVPAQSLILPAPDADGDGIPDSDADGDYFETSSRGFETLDSNENGTQFTGGGFVFYMPENIKKPLKNVQSYAEREAWFTEDYTDPTKPGQEVRNISFKNAPENSTYLEIEGTLTYKDGDGKAVSADTKFYVHLGYGDEDPNDYSTIRNYHYKYTITVQGIDDIKVEVERDGGPERPGYEGDVVYSDKDIFEFDCHYDRRLIKLNRKDLASEDLSWGVSTPYSNGIHRVGEEIKETMRDYRWIKFAINKDYGVPEDKFVKYPGDQNYDDPFINDGTDDQPSPYYNGGDGGNYASARLMDIEQLLVFLKEEADDQDSEYFDDYGNVSVSVYVDEFLYIKDPTKAGAETDLSLWKSKSVNQPDRMLHIISQGAQYSADGNSSIVNSLYTFKQKSIRTIYNTASDVGKAWGLESVMETDRLPVDEDMTSDADDLTNGRSNTWTYIQSKRDSHWDWGWEYYDFKWTDVLNTDNQYSFNSKFSYKNVFFACLMRNRDLNGDNIVQENEIRWYLASINQLTDIYIGEYSLDAESRLYPYDPRNDIYPPNGNNNVYWHYASSTYQGTERDGWSTVRIPYVVWAEEGPSKGNYLSSKGLNGSNYAYRCVRNLGIPLDDIKGIPDDFVQMSPDGTVFDLSYLDPKGLRSYYVAGAGEYTKHDEKSEHNLPYVKFEVNYSIRGNNTWTYYQTYNPCENDGFRVPNMRELLIYTSRGNITGNYHLQSYTGFSMNGFGPYAAGNRNGYSYNTEDGSMGPANHQGHVMGVRDVR